MAEILFAPVCSYCGEPLYNTHIVINKAGTLSYPKCCPKCNNPFSMFIGVNRYYDIDICVHPNRSIAANPEDKVLDLLLDTDSLHDLEFGSLWKQE